MKTILVVDDEPNIQRLVRFHLEHKGYKVLLAGNGQEALRLLERRLVNVILTDIMMPIMDGFVFLAELQQNSKLASIPVIVMQWPLYNERGYDEQVAEAKAKLNVAAVVPKPFAPASLIAQVDALFEQPG
jgi:CheY-like chemotaxis protein